MMKKNVSVATVVTCVVTPYLAMGLGLGAIGNMIGFVINMKKKGKNNGSGKDWSIS